MSRCKRRSRVVQTNKQVNIVQVACPGSKSRCRKKTKRRRLHPRPRPLGCLMATGRIFQRCGEAPRLYFEAPTEPCRALVRIDNDTRCTMLVRIEQQSGQPMNGEVEQGQQVSFVAPTMRKLTIACRGESGICKGYYRIRLLQ